MFGIGQVDQALKPYNFLPINTGVGTTEKFMRSSSNFNVNVLRGGSKKCH